MQPSGEVGRFEVDDQPSPPADRLRYRTRTETRRVSQHSVVIERSTADGAVARVAITVIIGVALAYAWVRGNDDRAHQLVVDTSLSLFFVGMAIFITCFMLATIYQCVFPVRYTSTISADSIVFARSGFPEPEACIKRSETVKIARSRPPWYRRGRGQSLLYTYVFELSGGECYEVSYRYIWAGNQNEFADAVEKLWQWPALPNLPEIKLAGR